MTQNREVVQHTLFTIGYEGASVGGLIAALKDAGVTLLVDYADPDRWLFRHIAGHAPYTRSRWLPHHCEVVTVGLRKCANQPPTIAAADTMCTATRMLCRISTVLLPFRQRPSSLANSPPLIVRMLISSISAAPWCGYTTVSPTLKTMWCFPLSRVPSLTRHARTRCPLAHPSALVTTLTGPSRSL